jgi:hypothetical protein
MKRHSGILTLGVLIGSLVFAGCSSNQGTNAPFGYDSADQTVDLNDPFGGFLPTDEDPAFGDEALAALTGDEVTLTEEEGYAGLSPEELSAVQEIIDQPFRDWFTLTVIWGQPEHRTDGTLGGGADHPAVTWDGSMTFEGGVIRVLSLISFEPFEDRLVRDEDRPDELGWISVTHGYHDGLRVFLMLPPGEAGAADDVVLRFQAEPFGEVEFTLGELGNLDVLYEVPNSTEKVSFRGFRMSIAGLRGFLDGEWAWAEGDSVGRFRGRWVSARGVHLGYVRGHYGLNDLEQPVFFGKYVDVTGGFEGILRGQYEVTTPQFGPNEDSPRFLETGKFWGDWCDRRSLVIGDVRGHWTQQDGSPGFFRGVWHASYAAP